MLQEAVALLGVRNNQNETDPSRDLDFWRFALRDTGGRETQSAQAREFFDELQQLAEKELKRSGEFVLPGMVKLVVQNRQARMGRNPATGEAIQIPAKTVVKARIAKQLKDSVLPS